MNGLHSLYPLKGVVQHYSWGGFDFIPDLLKTNNEDKKPFAEYWLGTHPNCPSGIVTPTGEEKLDQFIQKNDLPSLPFLLKVLDVRQMLSIQVHPDKISAQKGFEEENEKGVPHNAPHRNYKDTNHKPELMVALSDFWLLHGFKNESELRKTLESIQEFHFLIDIFQQGHYKALYEHVMKMGRESINAVLQPLIDRILPLYRSDQLQKNDPGFWAARAVETFCKEGQLDRGIFSIYFFNLLFLKKGEGVYQPSELPHA